MKIRSATIVNFRGIRELHLDFVNSRTGQVRDLTCLIGDNGSGKTTALQAIALVLSMATRKTSRFEDLNWHGFIPERVSSLGSTMVELEVEFSDDEIATTVLLWNEWAAMQPAAFFLSASGFKERVIRLRLERGVVSSPNGIELLDFFLGRFRAKSMLRSRPELQHTLTRVGDVFWFDQYRNISVVNELFELDKRPIASWQSGVEQLREYLVGWWGYHTSRTHANGKDYIPLLEQRFERLFPGTKFIGIAPRANAVDLKSSDFYFLLERDGRVYDIAEMSSGEQAIFPLIYEFVRLDISRSVVLIDELEMHLHPPQQQALLGSLKEIGPDCQFIITTHSAHLTDVIPNEQEIRLPGGSLCL